MNRVLNRELDREIIRLNEKLVRAPSEQKRPILEEMGRIAIEGGLIYDARTAFSKLGDIDSLRKVAELGLKIATPGDGLYDTLAILKELGDTEGFKRCIERASTFDDKTGLDNLFDIEGTHKKINQRFREYAELEGFPSAPTGINYEEVVNDLGNLAERYDMGISVARGGLFGGYLLSQLGFPVQTIEAHRRGNGTTFNWGNANPNDLTGKRVLLLENDFATGKTGRRVLREVRKATPEKVGIYFSLLSPSQRILENQKSFIPDFDEVHYRGDFKPNNFPRYYDKLVSSLN